VERLLGEGERKQVYLARDLQMDRDVALGLIGEEPPVDRGLTLTEWECRVTARLVNHPHIVTIYDVGEHEGQRYIVSQYMRGGDLRGVLKSTRAQGRELPLGLALRYASEICDALAYAHDRSIIHRDVQPGNVWLDEPEGSAHLGDFDLALAPDAPDALRDPRHIVTTRAYMPPEEARGEPLDGRGDIYSLGATMYELLVARAPFEGTEAEILQQHLTSEPKPPSQLRDGVPKALEGLILRMLAKNPTDRPGSPAEVLDVLRAVTRSLARPEVTLAELIRGGESAHVEFKSSLRYDRQTREKNPRLELAVAKTVAGFMNGEGGTLLIGVDDEGRVIGIEDDITTLNTKPNRDGWELHFTTIMENHLGPDAAACVSVEFETTREGTVAVVRCLPRSRPTWVRDGKARILFARIGNSTRRLPEPFADVYIEDNWPR
jgi:serine/threonine protein kinase